MKRHVHGWNHPCGHALAAAGLSFLVALLGAGASGGADLVKNHTKQERAISYTNDLDPEGPWSIHVVRIDRSHPELRLATTLGDGQTLGMGTVSEQLKSWSRELGQPIAAINGDFYEKEKNYAGRPRDVQIREGEVVSHPAGHACFWIDAEGHPQMTNVFSRFRVVWPNGKTVPLFLNAPRPEDGLVLFTAVIGKSTLTRGGVEYVLERGERGPWLPLRAGHMYEARVRAVRQSGDSPIEKETAVLSVGPELGAQMPALERGATVKIILETFPDLSGVEVAIGGGPVLIQDGKLMEWKGLMHMRHPRTAFGWSKSHYYLVEVDGRQLDVSVGMTFQELAEYMLKLGCEHAMNLDGGGSATLWFLGDVRNSPSEGRERPAPNALVVVRKLQARDSK